MGLHQRRTFYKRSASGSVEEQRRAPKPQTVVSRKVRIILCLWLLAGLNGAYTVLRGIGRHAPFAQAAVLTAVGAWWAAFLTVLFTAWLRPIFYLRHQSSLLLVWWGMCQPLLVSLLTVYPVGPSRRRFVIESLLNGAIMVRCLHATVPAIVPRLLSCLYPAWKSLPPALVVNALCTSVAGQRLIVPCFKCTALRLLDARSLLPAAQRHCSLVRLATLPAAHTHNRATLEYQIMEQQQLKLVFPPAPAVGPGPSSALQPSPHLPKVLLAGIPRVGGHATGGRAGSPVLLPVVAAAAGGRCDAARRMIAAADCRAATTLSHCDG